MRHAVSARQVPAALVVRRPVPAVERVPRNLCARVPRRAVVHARVCARQAAVRLARAAVAPVERDQPGRRGAAPAAPRPRVLRDTADAEPKRGHAQGPEGRCRAGAERAGPPRQGAGAHEQRPGEPRRGRRVAPAQGRREPGTRRQVQGRADPTRVPKARTDARAPVSQDDG